VIAWQKRKVRYSSLSGEILQLGRFSENTAIRASRAPAALLLDAGGNIAHNDKSVAHVKASMLMLDPTPCLSHTLQMGSLAVKSFTVHLYNFLFQPELTFTAACCCFSVFLTYIK
jgi:hypothetical protein